jgi:WD40 repeat protein
LRVSQSAHSPDDIIWQRIKDSTDPADYESFLHLFPESSYANAARDKLKTMHRSAPLGGSPAEAITKQPSATRNAATQAGASTASSVDWSHAKLVPQTGHTDHITSAIFSPNGQLVVTTSADGTAKIWNAESGILLRTLEGHEGEVKTAFFGSEGQILTTVGESGVGGIRRWAVSNGQGLGVSNFRGDTCVPPPVVSPDRKSILECSGAILDATSGRMLRHLHKSGEDQTAQTDAETFAFAPDGKIVISGDKDGTVTVWDAATGELIRSFGMEQPDPEYEKSMRDINSSFCRDAWLSTMCLVARATNHDPRRVNAIAVSPDGKTIAAGSQNGNLRLFDTASGQLIGSIKARGGRLDSVHFFPDGQAILTQTDKETAIWKTDDRSLIRAVSPVEGYFSDAALSAGGGRFLTVNSGGKVRIWDAGTGRLLTALNWTYSTSWYQSEDETRMVRASDKRYAAGVDSLTFISGGRTIVIGREKMPPLGWDIASGAVTTLDSAVAKQPRNPGLECISHLSDDPCVVTSRDGRVTASLSNYRKTINLSRVKKGKLRLTAKDSFGDLEDHDALALSADGKFIASAGGWIWQTRNGKLLRAIQDPYKNPISGTSISFSPGEKTLAIGVAHGKTDLFDVGTGQLVHVIDSHKASTWCVTFSPDGRLLATTSRDATVQFWDTSDYSLKAKLTLLGDDIVVQYPDGSYFAPDSAKDKLVLVDGLNWSLLSLQYETAHRRRSPSLE